MSQFEGLVEQVETRQAGSFATADASVSDAEVFVADVAPFLNSAGSCTVELFGVEYTATPDPDAGSLALSPVLSVVVAEGDPVVLVPAAEVKWAWVSLPDDDSVDPVQCRVPHELKGYRKLADGPRELELRETVVVETEPFPSVVTVLNQQDTFEASTVPITVTTDDGESIRLDGDGLTAFTDDPVPVRTIVGPFFTMTADGTYIYATDNTTTDLRKYDAATGVEDTSGFPITGPFTHLAADGTYIYATDGSNDIRKYDAATGVEDTSGFPIAGPFGPVAADGTYVYARDGVTNDLRKYDAATGTEDTSGFPIVGTFAWLAADGTYIYATDGSNDIRKYDAATGVEDTSGFPITGTFYAIAADGTYVYAGSGDIRKYDAATGVEDTSGFPIAGPFGPVAADGTYVYASDTVPQNIRVYNGAANYPSVLIDSSDGTLTAHALTASDATLSGDLTVGASASVAGDLDVDGDTTLDTLTLATYPVTGAWTTYTPTWTGAVSNPTGTATGAYQRVGNTVHFRIVLTSNATVGSGQYRVTLPFDCGTSVYPFTAGLFDTSASAEYRAFAVRDPGTANRLLLLCDPTTAGNALRALTNAVPVTIATGDTIIITGTYEAA